MKAALAQTNIIWEDKAANMITASEMISQAASNGCDLIVFPEMSLTGFSMNIDLIAEYSGSSETVSFFIEEAKRNNIYISFGTAIIESDGKIYNKAITVSNTGEIVSSYSKIHPFSHGVEAKYFTGGDEIKWFDLNGITASTFICYDLRFPEICQTASTKSRLLIVLACWPNVRTAHWDVLLKARAIENQSFIIGVNRTGREMKYSYNGHSQAVSPRGEVLNELVENEALIITEFNISDADDYRSEFQLKQDRKPQIYKQFL